MSRGIEKALAECLEKIEVGGATVEEALSAYPTLRAELEPLLMLVGELRSAPRVVAPESLRTSRRPVFVSRPRTVVVGGRGPRRWEWPALPTFGWAAPMARLAAGLTALVLLTGGSMVASANSLPEEPLYPVKLAVEGAQLALAQNPRARADLELQFAARRLEEVETAVRQGKTGAAERGLVLYEERVDSALQAAQVSSGATEGGNDQRLQESLGQQQEVLKRVLGQVPEQARPAILHAMEVSRQNQTRSGKDGAKPESREASQPGPTTGSTATPMAEKVLAPPTATWEPAGGREVPGKVKPNPTSETPRQPEDRGQKGPGTKEKPQGVREPEEGDRDREPSQGAQQSEPRAQNREPTVLRLIHAVVPATRERATETTMATATPGAPSSPEQDRDKHGKDAESGRSTEASSTVTPPPTSAPGPSVTRTPESNATATSERDDRRGSGRDSELTRGRETARVLLAPTSLPTMGDRVASAEPTRSPEPNGRSASSGSDRKDREKQ